MARLWMPDWPPASADDKDDEFADSSVAVAWTEFDQPNNLTVSEAASGLSLLQTTASGHNVAGVFKAIPTGDWSFWTKVSVSCPKANYTLAGVMLGADLTNNPSTSDIVTMHIALGLTTHYLEVFRWNAYNSYNSALLTLNDALFTTDIYFRVRKASTTYSFDYSTDGIGWLQAYTTASLPITPAEMGLFIDNNNTGSSSKAIFQFFRVVDGTPALTDVMGGQRVL